MRDWWYGDKRDIVKWGAILVLARKKSINTVLQVALYRPDPPNNYHLTIDGTTELLPNEVIHHFRDIDQIHLIEAKAKLRIDIHKDLFQWRAGFRTREDFRKSYFNEVARKIKEYREAVIVFLDPDTGIAPNTYGYKHVTPQEIQTTLRAMKPGDWLLFYQHARLGDGNWRNATTEEFGKAVNSTAIVDTITCNEIANDVAFFVVERSKWMDIPAVESKQKGVI
ncbi:hypothetical protein D4S03_03315 [bacterium]|nr:MAG: hypothetical protein D4S03_03315 [bacterium]